MVAHASLQIQRGGRSVLFANTCWQKTVFSFTSHRRRWIERADIKLLFHVEHLCLVVHSLEGCIALTLLRYSQELHPRAQQGSNVDVGSTTISPGWKHTLLSNLQDSYTTATLLQLQQQLQWHLLFHSISLRPTYTLNVPECIHYFYCSTIPASIIIRYHWQSSSQMGHTRTGFLRPRRGTAGTATVPGVDCTGTSEVSWRKLGIQ